MLCWSLYDLKTLTAETNPELIVSQVGIDLLSTTAANANDPQTFTSSLEPLLILVAMVVCLPFNLVTVVNLSVIYNNISQLLQSTEA